MTALWDRDRSQSLVLRQNECLKKAVRVPVSSKHAAYVLSGGTLSARVM